MVIFYPQKNPTMNVNEHRFSFQLLGLVIALIITLLVFSCQSETTPQELATNELTLENIYLEVDSGEQMPPAPIPPIFPTKAGTEEQALSSDTEDDLVYSFVEEMPTFSGCAHLTDYPERKKCSDENLVTFIRNNIQYPLEAREENIEGTVVVSFVINKVGRLEDINLIREIGGETGTESLRVINLMNDLPVGWTPGKQQGKVVKVKYNIPIRFSLEIN